MGWIGWVTFKPVTYLAWVSFIDWAPKFSPVSHLVLHFVSRWNLISGKVSSENSWTSSILRVLLWSLIRHSSWCDCLFLNLLGRWTHDSYITPGKLACLLACLLVTNGSLGSSHCWCWPGWPLRSTCHCLLSTGIKGVCHHVQRRCIFHCFTSLMLLCMNVCMLGYTWCPQRCGISWHWNWTRVLCKSSQVS